MQLTSTRWANEAKEELIHSCWGVITVYDWLHKEASRIRCAGRNEDPPREAEVREASRGRIYLWVNRPNGLVRDNVHTSVDWTQQPDRVDSTQERRVVT